MRTTEWIVHKRGKQMKRCTDLMRERQECHVPGKPISYLMLNGSRGMNSSHEVSSKQNVFSKMLHKLGHKRGVMVANNS